jgi:hypothetical protein
MKCAAFICGEADTSVRAENFYTDLDHEKRVSSALAIASLMTRIRRSEKTGRTALRSCSLSHTASVCAQHVHGHAHACALPLPLTWISRQFMSIFIRKIRAYSR